VAKMETTNEVNDPIFRAVLISELQKSAYADGIERRLAALEARTKSNLLSPSLLNSSLAVLGRNLVIGGLFYGSIFVIAAAILGLSRLFE
jgi:hypothetical protein